MSDKPGWGHPHVHEYKHVKTIGVVEIERCECGKSRQVITVQPPEVSGAAEPE